MSVETVHTPRISEARRGLAGVYLDDIHVGDTQVTHWDGSWGFGSFEPNNNFSKFAPLFGLWLLLLHVDDDRASLSRDAARELSIAERLLDRLHVRLHFMADNLWVPVAQLMIDRGQLEWKEY